MIPKAFLERESISSPVLLAIAALLATTIFVVDTLSPLGMAVAVLYVIVVLLSTNVLQWRGVLFVSLGCVALTLSSYLLAHGVSYTGAHFVRLLVSLSAIAITAFLALRNQAALTVLSEQARLLDLTHDMIFVRDMHDVITYWNRGAEALYGWHGDEAIGKVAHQLLQTRFPTRLEEITAELFRLGRWEGELTHVKRDGQRLVVESRWALERDERGRPAAVLETNTDITGRKRAEEKLRQAERELRTTIDRIPAMVTSTQPDGTVDFINARWVEQGFSEVQLRSDWTALVHPDDLPEMREMRDKSLPTGGSYEAEVRLRRIDGEYRWFLIRAVGLRDEAGNVVKRYATATDIEDRKRAEASLRRSAALFAQTQRLSHTGSVGFNRSTGGMFWSAESARIFGYDPSIKPTPDLVLERIHPDDLALARRSVELMTLGEYDSDHEYRLLMPDGSLKYVRAVAHAVPEPLEGREVLRALIDVTAAKRAETALREAQADLAHITRVTTLGEFTASIAHEVNQPLAAIVTNGEVCLRLLDHGLRDIEEVREGIGAMISNGRRASEIIRRVRALSKKSEPEMLPLDINDIINETIPLVQWEMLSHRVSHRLELAPTLPAVLGDRVQLQQVLINLVVNSMEAMGSVADRPRELVIRSRQEGTSHVVVAVEDSGVGIDPEKVSHLFDAFFTTKPEGMGMGLSICRSIIENHGGVLRASVNAGPGATFQFTLQSHREVRS